VNGGIPFPPNFTEKASLEFVKFNFLRALGRYLIPGYTATYRHAKQVLVGSNYTLNMLKQIFNLPDSRIRLFCENGISQDFLNYPDQSEKKIINLLFVGRLVPYKCADLVIDAIAQLDQENRDRVKLTIVGDGSEYTKLKAQIERLHLYENVALVGWVTHQKTLDYYRQSDVFCFPSIREFGGAVVLEAMANGLPCIVVNYGGIGEYVTDETGFRIEPISTEYITQQLVEKMALPDLR
jgi:glycosyltransferase involved in cell wall biosynthesis